MDQSKIKNMTIAGRILGEVMAELIEFVDPGVTELDIENLATELILKKGAKPSFKMVPGYKYSTCIAVNDVVVHGIPKKRLLKEGDVIGIDCGAFYNGYHSDMSETLLVKSSKLKVQSDKEIDKFLNVGKKALFEAIKQAKPGNRIGHISKAIQDIVEGAGYSVVRTLVGHGIGKNLHEKPEIPGFLDKKIESTPLIQPDMTLAIEVIYNMGTNEVVYGDDGWTIVTADKKLSGLFERTVLVTEKESIILTKLAND